MFGYGHIITYDGLAITLDAPGEYYFTDTGGIEVFVRHVSLSRSDCLHHCSVVTHGENKLDIPGCSNC